MTPEALARLPIGTEILIRAILKTNVPDRDGAIQTTHPIGRVEPASIVGPARATPLKVGDQVTREGRGLRRTILAIHGAHAFTDVSGGLEPETAPLAQLTLIPDSKAARS